MNLLFILSKTWYIHQPARLLTTIQNSKGHTFRKIFRIFLERLKDSAECKNNCVTSVDVRHDIKRRKVSEGMAGWWKKHFLSIISFLNDSQFYDEMRNELS